MLLNNSDQNTENLDARCADLARTEGVLLAVETLVSHNGNAGAEFQQALAERLAQTMTEQTPNLNAALLHGALEAVLRPQAASYTLLCELLETVQRPQRANKTHFDLSQDVAVSYSQTNAHTGDYHGDGSTVSARGALYTALAMLQDGFRLKDCEYYSLAALEYLSAVVDAIDGKVIEQGGRKNA